MCYAGSGSFTRSGINYQSGAKTPLSAVFAAVSLALILLFVAPLTAYLPIAAMGGIILLVAYNLIDFHHTKQIAKASKQELIVLLATFLSTLFLHLEFAIYIGVILSLVFYLQRISKPRVVTLTSAHDSKTDTTLAEVENKECPQLKIIRIYGSLFFGAMEHVGQQLDEITDEGYHKVLIVCNGINLIDIAGAEFLTTKAQQLRDKEGTLYLSGLNPVVREYMDKGGYTDKFGPENIYINKEYAIDAIYKQLDQAICDSCETRIFKECNA
jgi:SulP family sulfate permease